jgi:hypothetical protein
MDEQSGADMVREAFDDVAVEVADAAGIPVESNSIDVPNSIFIGSYGIDGLDDSVVVPIPNIGFGTVMVLSPNTVPEITEHVDTAQDSTIDFNGIGVSQWGEEPKMQDNVTPGNGLIISGGLGNAIAGVDVNLMVDCPDDVAFPATLETNSFSGVSLAWSTFDSCPVVVIFNADAAGSYAVQFTLTDSNGKKWNGSITLTVVAAFDGECQEDSMLACYDSVPPCSMDEPPAGSGDRAERIYTWFCGGEAGQHRGNCSYQYGCVNDFTVRILCQADCNFAGAACLEAIEETQDPDYLADCYDKYVGCIAPCM